jgi:hypothetical protein
MTIREELLVSLGAAGSQDRWEGQSVRARTASFNWCGL